MQWLWHNITMLCRKLIHYLIISLITNSGTEKQHVANDYAKRLHIGQVECQKVMTAALNQLASKDINSHSMDLQFCEYLNISYCPISQTGQVYTIYC